MNKKQINYAILSMQSWLENTYPLDDIAHDEQIVHLLTMIPKMKLMVDDDREKLMRWMGFMQGALWALGYFTVDDFREMNTKDIK